MPDSCIIYVFSGTGNTLMVAREYARALDMETRICCIASSFDDLPSPEEYSLVGIGYPVHAFNAPHIVERFARWLTCDSRKPLFLFHTGGEGLSLNDASSISIRHVLGSHFDILSERHYVMPYNMIFRHPDAMVKHMVNYMRRLVQLHVQSILSGQHERFRPMPLRHLISMILRIEWIYARAQGRYMKAGESCSGCGLCVRSCPMGNIRMEKGRPVFGNDCELCVRCSFSCPDDAISIGLLNGWKVNGPYDFDRIMDDGSIDDTILVNELSFLYRGYYKKADRLLRGLI